MKTKTSHSWKAKQNNFIGYAIGQPYTGKPNSKLDENYKGATGDIFGREKDFPEWVIIPIVIAGFIGFYYAGAIAEWLLNLQTILN